MLPVSFACCLNSDGSLKVFMIDVLVSISQTQSVSKGRFEIALPLAVVISRRQKRVQLMRIREKDGKKRQQAGGQEGTYRRKATPVKRYAGDLLAPVSVSQQGVCCSDFFFFSPILIYLNTSKCLSEWVMFSALLPLHNACLSVFCRSSSQSYLQSLRDRQMGTGTSLSSLGTTNPTMVDMDCETGSMVPLTATTPVVRVWPTQRKKSGLPDSWWEVSSSGDSFGWRVFVTQSSTSQLL